MGIPREGSEERRIVQMIEVADPSGSFEQSHIIALCNDGSMWKLYLDKNWHRLPDIPKGEKP